MKGDSVPRHGDAVLGLEQVLLRGNWPWRVGQRGGVGWEIFCEVGAGLQHAVNTTNFTKTIYFLLLQEVPEIPHDPLDWYYCSL